MRIGPFTISRSRKFADSKPSRPPAGELGVTGVSMFGGWVSEDYNPDLRGAKAFETYDKMLRGDGQVQALELTVTLPIMSAAWHVDPGDDSAASREAAELIQSNLFGGMTVSWAEFLRQSLLGALMGVTLAEKVWEIRDNLVVWRKFAPRHPRTVWKWDTDIGGGIQGIIQHAIDPVTGGFRDISIPIDKLVRFTWRGDWGNPEGRALLRPAYKHWFTKDALYKIVNIAIERFGIGTPRGRLPEGYSEADKDALLAILQDYKSGEATGIALPPGYELDILEGNLRVQGIQGIIEHHDVMIVRSVLAQFINLGATASGSRALADAQSRFFLLGENAIADWFADHINRYAIPQWVAYNYPGLDANPTLEHAGIETVLEPEAIAIGLTQLAQGNMLTPDDDVENIVRGWFDLPPLPEDHTRTVAQPNEEPAQASDGARPPSAVIKMGDRRYDPRPHRQRGQQMRADETDFEINMRRVVEDQHARLLEKLEPIIQDFKAAPDLEKGKHIARMQAVTVPLIAKYENALRGWLWQLFSAARDRAAAEFSAKPGPVSNAMRQWINAKAQVLAQDHSERLRAQILHELLDVIRRDLGTGDILKVLGATAKARATVDLGDGLRQAGEDLVGLINGALVEIQRGQS